MISDEIIYHFQSIKKGLFIENFASEVKANLIKYFLYSIRANLACSVFLSYFLRLATAFKIRPTPVKVVQKPKSRTKAFGKNLGFDRLIPPTFF